MSVLRFFSPSRRSRPSSLSPSTSRPSSRSSRGRSRGPLKPRLEINVPSYGSVFMTPSTAEEEVSDPSLSPQAPIALLDPPPGPSGGHPQPSSNGSTPDSHVDIGGTGIPNAGEPSRPTRRSRQRQKETACRGELVIDLPPGMGRRRVKKIRVGMKTMLELAMGPERGMERDTIFDRNVEIRGARHGSAGGPDEPSDEGIVLEEGIQRYDFTIPIPSDLPGHDRHLNGKIDHCIYAELIGLSKADKARLKDSSKGHLGKGKSAISARTPVSPRPTEPPLHPSGSGSRPGSAHSPDAGYSGTETPQYTRYPLEKGEGVNATSLSEALNSMSVNSSDTLPPVPPYEGPGPSSQTDDEVEWLEGTVTVQRYNEVLHNIEPSGGIHELNTLLNGAVEGLGPYNLSMVSDAWTIGALLIANLTLPAPSPQTTIFSFRVSLSQTHDVRSPRDPPDKPPLSTTQSWEIFTLGKRPDPRDFNPGATHAALWRGLDAKGCDTGELVLEGTGRNPDDIKARPTTPEYVPSPIQVKHKLVVEIQFSVWGEDHFGQPIPGGGPGRTRAMVIQKATQVASCAFTPEELRLPTYGSLKHEDAFTHLARKCPLCGLDPPDKVCKTCPPTSIPHARHDHPAKLVGNDEGICPLCAKEVVPVRAPSFEDCACGMSTEYLLKRMKGRGGANHGGELRLEFGIKQEEVERGRRR